MSLDDSVSNLQAEEIRLHRLIAASIAAGVMIDVGAHHGEMMMPFLEAGWKAYAFEPIAMNRETLVRRVGDHPNVIIRSEAVSRHSGIQDFYLALNPDRTLHEYYHSLEKIGLDAYHQKGETIQIQTVSLDDLVAQGELPRRVDYLKIDTEGHDLEVLRGAASLECEVISVEFWCEHHNLGASPSPPEAIVELLKTRGFEQFIVLSREGSQPPAYLFSSLAGLGKRSWGNIFFYSPAQSRLFSESVQLCQSLAVSPQNRSENSPFLQLLSTLFTGDELSIIDIGAFQGDFTATILTHFPRTKALLFEPSSANCEVLKQRFSHNPKIRIVETALSNQEQLHDFYLMDDAATNSLLAPNQPFTTRTRVFTQTLDTCIQQSRVFDRIDLVKVDTQGNDLKVLQGAVNTIQQYAPILLVELIFVSLYKGQDSYYEILNFMHSHDYRWGGIYNIHYTQSGQIAYCDALFIPVFIEQRLPVSDRFVCQDLEYLTSQNRMLQTVCEERLELIHTLNQTAEERLQVIHVLDAEVKRLQVEIQRLLAQG